MPVTFKAGAIIALATDLGAVLQLSPPALPKGRYALSRAGIDLDTGKHVQHFLDEKRKLLDKHALQVDGKPVTREIAPGQIQYDMGKGFGVTTPEYDADFASMCDVDVTLSGPRQITMAELGPCPITAGQMATLIRCGLLENKEPE